MLTYDETRDYLFALKNRGSKFGIERMERLVAALGHPERQFPVIHVAGTNGKGSVCAMLESLYRSSGYKTGLFTSPHLVHLGERVQVNRKLLDESGIMRYVKELRSVADKLGDEEFDLYPTFFEFIAAMAFLRFAVESVDIACIETGLGGRLDATNVVEPELSIITSISFDHMEMLGDTLAKIAEEKAGIIKPGKPVLMGCLPEEAEIVIRRVAHERHCSCYSVRERFREDDLPQTNLAGQFQRWNAGTAVYASELLAERFPVESTGALGEVDWPGRWQSLQIGERTLILDATHNPEGAAALADNLKQLVSSDGRKPIIVAGTLGEERGRSLMQAVAPFAGELFLIRPDQDRAIDPARLETFLPEGGDFSVRHASLDDLFASSDKGVGSQGVLGFGQPGDTIVVTGSIYLIGEVLELMQGNTGSGSELQDKI